MICRSSYDIYMGTWKDGREFSQQAADMLFWKGVEVTGLSERLYSRFNLEAVLAYMGVENVSLAFGREYAYNLNISIIRLYNYFKEVFECFRNRKIIT